jgi:hypothetical protein
MFILSQKRFLITGEPEEEPTTWWVPITYTKKNSIDFSTTTPTVWLEDVAEADIETELAEDEWIILNIQETGIKLNIQYTFVCVLHLFQSNFMKLGETLEASPPTNFSFPFHQQQKTCQPCKLQRWEQYYGIYLNKTTFVSW